MKRSVRFSLRARRLCGALLAAGLLTTAQAGTAVAAAKPVPFSFKYRLESQTWQQGAGKTTLRIMNCNKSEKFHAELFRSRVGRDASAGGATLKCAKGQEFTYKAPVEGTYYFVFTKLDDGKVLKGDAIFLFPDPS